MEELIAKLVQGPSGPQGESHDGIRNSPSPSPRASGRSCFLLLHGSCKGIRGSSRAVAGTGPGLGCGFKLEKIRYLPQRFHPARLGMQVGLRQSRCPCQMDVSSLLLVS